MVGGTAGHVHVSVKKGDGSLDANVPEAPGLNIVESEFLSGLMDHLQAVAAFTMPSIGSYERLTDGTWAVNSHFI